MPLPGEPNAYVLQLDPAGAANSRVMLDINNPSTGIQVGGTSSGTGIDWGTSQFTQLMAQEGQWGSAPADFIVPNRTITIPLGLGMGGPGTPNANTALNNLAEKVGLLQREGGWLLRQRSGEPAMYCDIVDAELQVPDVWGETGAVEPGVTLTLITAPDWYGDEIALDSIPCTGYCEAVLTSGGVTGVIEGDHPARVRLVYSSSNSQTELYWGLQSRNYDSSATAGLQYEAENLSVQTSAGASVVSQSGASNGEVVKITPTADTWTAMVELYLPSASSFLTHQGTYEVLARAYSATELAQLYLRWTANAQQGDINVVNTAAALQQTSNFCIVSLGVVSTQPVSSPYTTQWTGVIYGKVGTTGHDVSVDEIFLRPLDEYAGHITGTFFGSSMNLQVDSGGAWNITASDVAGPTGTVLGDLPRLPPSGLERRPVRLFAKPIRSVDSAIDPFTVTPFYRPTYMFRP